MYDVIVVGTGLGGLTTTLKLGNKKIALLDKAVQIGGNSIRASSGINGVPTKYQPVRGDSVGLFINDTLKSGNGQSDAQLVEILANHSKQAITWLSEDMKVDLSEVAQLGGHSMPRTHRGGYASGPPGFEIIGSLAKKVKQSDNVGLFLNSKLTRILMKKGNVEGIEYEAEGKRNILKCKHLVLATGGYAADIHDSDSLVRQFRPELVGFPSTNSDSTTGDGHKIAYRDCNAQLIQMTEIQIHPTGFVSTDPHQVNNRKKILCGELLRGIGAILISPNTGKRFIDELQTRDVMSDSILRNCKVDTTLLSDEGAPAQSAISIIAVPTKDYSKAKSHIDFYTKVNLLKEGGLNDLYTLVKRLNPNIKQETLLQTLNKYNAVMDNGDSLGRTTFGNKFNPEKFYFGLVTPVLHYTMGGVKIDVHANVVTKDEHVISNLYAVGEVGGGLHGHNRLSGSSLLQCVVFGTSVAERIIQREAKHYSS